MSEEGSVVIHDTRYDFLRIEWSLGSMKETLLKITIAHASPHTDVKDVVIETSLDNFMKTVASAYTGSVRKK